MVKNKRRKKKKDVIHGFTLVELIIVIAILGVILVMALPQVSQIQSENKYKKYYAYKDTITSAAKIYIDNHKTDLYGNSESGCVIITYSMLKLDNLIKDFGEKGVNCSNDSKTFVVVNRQGSKYTYTTNITCTIPNQDPFVDNDKNGTAESLCSDKADPSGTPPTLSITPTNTSNVWYNATDLAKKLKLKVHDDEGLNKNISIKWEWQLIKSHATNSSKTPKSETYTHNFNNKASTETKDLVLSVPKKKIPNDTVDSGEYRLVLSPNNKNSNYGVQDYFGNVKYDSVSAQTYLIDNEPPTMSPSISSTKSGYNALTTKITLNGNDNVKVSQMYISNTSYTSGGSWESYKSTKNWTVTGSYDGKKRTIYIRLKDSAGNITDKKITYTVYKECTEKVDSGSWYDITDCSAQCGNTGTKTQQIQRKDKYLGTSCGTRNQTGVACNRRDCCSSVKYEKTSTCSVKCGGGNLKREAYSNYNGQRCSNKDDWNGARCNTQSCCSSTRTEWNGWGGCNVSCGDGKQSRTGTKYSTYDGSNCGPAYEERGCNAGSCCSAQNPTACPQYHSCRRGNTKIYDKPGAGYFEGYVNDSQTLYKIGEDNGKWYVYVSGSIKGYYSWRLPSGYGYIYSNCIEPISVSCEWVQCPG